ncbi:MAG: hypothetical protein HC857_04645 [Synechococcales cyanobacterium RU_4_20]|nr:hypothetical protein [Synechococcales cyanobacterium RU_4_20]
MERTKTIIGMSFQLREYIMHYATTKQWWYPPPDIRVMIEELAKLSNNLYNCGIWENRQFFFDSGRRVSKFLVRSKTRDALKGNENIIPLHSQAAQALIDSVCEAFKSYKGLMKAWKYNLIPTGHPSSLTTETRAGCTRLFIQVKL